MAVKPKRTQIFTSKSGLLKRKKRGEIGQKSNLTAVWCASLWLQAYIFTLIDKEHALNYIKDLLSMECVKWQR